MKQEQPDFRFLTFATGVYYFQRLRDVADYDLREMFHIVYSFSDHTMQASVSSRLNPVYAFSPVYNSGLINPHIDLGSYQCDGSLASARNMIEVVINDFKNKGIPYLDDRWNSMRANKLIKMGLNIIDGWNFDKTMLGNELQLQLRRAKFKVARLKHPLLNDLREQLESIPGQTTDTRRDIPRLVFDLVELYCGRRIALY
ncbi:MAG TPA: hypothetical protein VFE50_12625 [Cyclobacteriaceae bacterium]|nr:hypothetical protein [Cyclobacteriaceae bacterium]